MRINKLLSLLICAAALAFAANADAKDIDWSKVDAAIGRSATVSGPVHRYSFPRSDLSVMLDGVSIKPALALSGWIAFLPVHDEAMVMGDVVLTESEIKPVMKLLSSGLEITAIHNHLLRAHPATFYMHVGGYGDPVQMAGAIRSALAESKTPAPERSAASVTLDLPTARLDEAMGVKGKATGGIYQFSVPRREPIRMDGMALPNAMGTANGINFQPTGGGKAAITGDFLVTGDEVNPLIRTLTKNGIEITAIHSHMLDEQPRMFFVHFWANDNAEKLARGIHAALKQTAVTIR